MMLAASLRPLSGEYVPTRKGKKVKRDRWRECVSLYTEVAAEMGLPESSPKEYGHVLPGTYKRGEDLPFIADATWQPMDSIVFESFASGYHLENKTGLVAAWAMPGAHQAGPLLFTNRANAEKYSRDVAGNEWQPEQNGDFASLLRAWGDGRYCWLCFDDGRLGFIDVGCRGAAR